MYKIIIIKISLIFKKFKNKNNSFKMKQKKIKILKKK